MARDYVLNESPNQRKGIICAIRGLTTSARAKKTDYGGIEIELSMEFGKGFEEGDYRNQLLKQLEAGVPLSEIPEFEKWWNEFKAEAARDLAANKERRSRWRAIGKFRDEVQANAASILNRDTPPTVGECSILMEVVRACPLLAGDLATMNDVWAISSRHPWLANTVAFIAAHLRFIECSPNRHKGYFISRMWESWLRRHRPKPKSKRGCFVPTPQATEFIYDSPPIIFFPAMHFLFSGKFKYGSRRQCHQSVVERGGQPLERASRWVDYLVIASQGENTGTNSSSCAPALGWREEGWPCFVITEEQWVSALKQ